MVSGYAVAAFAWIYYGLSHNLVLFVVVNVVEGLAFAWSYPAKQGFLVQASPARWLGSVQGLEQSAIQVAALVGTLLAPVLYQYMSGYVISVAGAVSLAGLVVAGPILYKEWNRLKTTAESAEETVEAAIEIAPRQI